jgi:hypothetical protein
MLETLKQTWRELKSGRPGRRFRAYYERRKTCRDGGAKKLLCVGGGAVVLLAGIALMPAPGPGLLVALVGVALLARGSPRAARVFDRVELRLRRWLSRARSSGTQAKRD